MYALIKDEPIPVESLRSVLAGPRGRVLVTGTTANSGDRKKVEDALSTLHKKDVVTFNVVTSDWRSISGRARITDITLAARESDVHFFVIMNVVKKSKPSKKI